MDLLTVPLPLYSRIAHRIRDLQRLPYVVVTNPHINEVYDLYYNAFDTFRKVKEIKTLEDNDRLCTTIRSTLKAHLTVIPKLAMGILESSELMNPEDLDKFMNTILRSVRNTLVTVTWPCCRIISANPPFLIRESPAGS